MNQSFKEQMRNALAATLSSATNLELDLVARSLEEPKKREFGDLAFPCFPLAKAWKKSPKDCAEQLLASLELPEGIEEVTPLGPFLNFRFSKAQFTTKVISDSKAFEESGTKENSQDTNKETILIEYSSPNIAKPFHVGHLRATLIGNSLERVYRFLEHPTVSVNHLGDWGTQFGFVWAGCELWETPKDEDVRSLVDIYKRATSLKAEQEKDSPSEEASKLPDVNEMARSYFLRLEEGESKAKSFWQWCLNISLDYLKKTYERLGVSFDHYIGESFYSDKLDSVKEYLQSKSLLSESEDALGVELGEELGFARITTSDGRSLYLTRDIAAARYRHERFGFAKSIYVVGMPQTLHFQQLKEILRKAGDAVAEKIIHVGFGHVMGMSTRGEGGFIELNDFLADATQRALTAYKEQVTKRPEGLDTEEVSKKVALAAIIFGNLSRTRTKDVQFDWETALQFQGDTGPYLLYAFARINGIEEKFGVDPKELESLFDAKHLVEDAALALVGLLDDFYSVLERTCRENDPFFLSQYALQLAKDFSKAYNELRVSGEDEAVAASRLVLFRAVRKVLGTSLKLLGIEPLERM